jgi:pSer/pThr/pTyr-binding forkhead associated (FHA) protein
MTLGLVCDECDTLSVLSATTCSGCGATLGIVPRGSSSRSGASDQSRGARAAAAAASKGPSASPVPTPAAVPAAPSARVCSSCNAPVVPGQKFCGECGTRMPDGAASAAGPATPGRTQYFGAMQTPGRAKLILIKGDGMDGVSFHLVGTEHFAGRSEGAILFPEDRLLSPRHANFFYRDGQLNVRDENSHNGVYIRIRSPIIVDPGASFLVGEQLLRIEPCPPDTMPLPDDQGTYFYGSPKRPARVQLVQILTGGEVGMIYRARTDTLSLGREGNDINFPNDPFVSGRHATVSVVEGGRLQITDLGSRNGTFLRIHGQTLLQHGDYVFLGQQLLRVEII